MANMVCNHLYVEGPAATVDNFEQDGGLIGCSPAEPEGAVYPDWHLDNWGVKWISGDGVRETVREADGVKLVRYAFCSLSAPPFLLVHHAIRKYHDAGLRFFFAWRDDDDGFAHDPLFGGDDINVAASFGEIYTKVISAPRCDQAGNAGECGSSFKEGAGVVHCLAINRSGGRKDIMMPWFVERGFTEAKVKALTNEQMVAAISEVYPDHIVVTHLFPQDNEVLRGGIVVNRIRYLNDLILGTWGDSWFRSLNVACGSASEDNLTDDEFDKLICDAYPDYSADYLRHDSRRVQRELGIGTGLCESALRDYFCRLEKQS